MPTSRTLDLFSSLTETASQQQAQLRIGPELSARMNETLRRLDFYKVGASNQADFPGRAPLEQAERT